MELLNFLEWLSNFPAECWLIPPILILAVISIIGFVRRQIFVRQCEDIARRVNLRLDAGNLVNSPSISGEYKGRAVKMFTVSRRGEMIRTEGTRITMTIDNPADIRLSIWKEDIFDVVIKLAGEKDIKVGDEAFDRQFFVSSDQAEAARSLLAGDEGLRRDILRTGATRMDVHYETLTCSLRIVERDPAHAELVLNAISDLADGVGQIKPREQKEILR
jgi:hypothetical protein